MRCFVTDLCLSLSRCCAISHILRRGVLTVLVAMILVSWTSPVDACPCPCWADPNCDGLRSDLSDVLQIIDVAFRGCAADLDPGCATSREDTDNGGVVDVLDVVRAVNVAFRGFAPTAPMQFVDPCPGAFAGAPKPIDLVTPDRATSDTPVATNSVLVESKTVPPNATGVKVGVYISNCVPIRAMVIPLELRELNPGAYVAGSFVTGFNTQGRIWNTPLAGTNPNGSNGFVQMRQYPTPGGTGCSGPTSNSYHTSGSVDFVSPDASMLVAISQADPNSEDYVLEPGADQLGVPSYTLTFNVTGVSGSFVIDTCCITPANHLVFAVETDLDFCDPEASMVPAFTSGTLTIGTPDGCAVNTETDNYLVACPRGDVPFSVQLLDGSGDPIADYYDVWLDFSACGAELTPIAGYHPTWPIVYPYAASDANGNVDFYVYAGGDCADCDVTVTTACGFSTTVPAHSLDVTGDMCVDVADHDPAEDFCRDYNGDGIVDGDDSDLNTDHLGHCAPAGPCDYISLYASISPDGALNEGDMITVNWEAAVTGYPVTCDPDCDITTIEFYHYDCDNAGTMSLVASQAVNQTVPAGASISGSVQYLNPDEVDFCLVVRVYSTCCQTYLEKVIRRTVARQCSPIPNCFSFYMTHRPGAYGIPSPASLLSQGWTFNISEEVVDNVLRTKSTICVGPNAISGTEAGYRIFGANGFIKEYRISLEPLGGDVCGIVQDCNGNPNQGGPDCILDVIDVICLVNYIFRNGVSPSPCPEFNADITCDGIPDVLDVVTEVNTIFRNAIPPDPCP